jgi:hypothetical protein
MHLEVSALGSRATLYFVLFAGLGAACSGSTTSNTRVVVPEAPDAGEQQPPTAAEPKPTTSGCVDVALTGDTVVEQLQDFTAEFQAGEAYDRTVMLFGGATVAQPNTPSRAYIYALDKVDAQRMAQKYPDFYLCSSPGGQEAATYIQVYDLVPANCEIHDKLATALKHFARNAARGGDRTSLRLRGAPLTVTSVTSDANGQDVSDQVSDQRFHLITEVQELTGQSLLGFGTTK